VSIPIYELAVLDRTRNFLLFFDELGNICSVDLLINQPSSSLSKDAKLRTMVHGDSKLYIHRLIELYCA